MTDSYQQLCTEFYDQSKPEAISEELKFYTEFLKEREGPYLEAMCGSGRLLIPLLRSGLEIDGVDSSPYMLESCLKRCKTQKLNPCLFQQSLQSLSLPKKYNVIFISLGSFQLISDVKEASLALKKLLDHLLPGGVLLLELFVPWDGIKVSIVGSCLLNTATVPFERKEILSDCSVIVYKGITTDYHKEQLQVTEGEYIKTYKNKVIANEKENIKVRWYHRYEMELFLKLCGFSKVNIIDCSFELNPQALIYLSCK